MNSLIQEIVEKLHHLPEPKVQEVLDFIRFLSWQTMNSQESLMSEELLSIPDTLSIDTSGRSHEESRKQFEELLQSYRGQVFSNSVELLREDRQR
jgi:hypothetical protein